MHIPQPVISAVGPPRPVQILSSGRGGKVNVRCTRFIEGWEPEVLKLWDFAEDIIREVHLYARVQISDDFVGETFYTHFFNARGIQIPFLDCRSVNRSVQWIDVLIHLEKL